MTDPHGDMVDRRVLKLLRAFKAEFKPKLTIHLGDNWDLRAFRSGAAEDEKRESIRKDFAAGVEFLEWLQPDYFLRGNHDERLWDQMKKTAGPMNDLAVEKVAEVNALVEKLGCRMLPYDKRRGILKLRKQRFAHGYFDGVSAPRQMGMAYGDVTFGHNHAFASAPTPQGTGRSIGALCRLDMDYNRKQVQALGQGNGWAFGVIDKAGHWHQFEARVHGGKVVFPHGLKFL